MGIGTRSNEFTLADFISLFQCPLTGRADAICLPFDGIDPRATARRACDVPIASSPDRGDQQGDSCRRERQSDKAPLKPRAPCSIRQATLVAPSTRGHKHTNGTIHIPQVIFSRLVREPEETLGD